MSGFRFGVAVAPRTSLPTYRSTLPGAPPTYPKSASAISPGPLTMQPMMAIATPGRWPVRSEICAVTSCRSKRVRPHEGHDTNLATSSTRVRGGWAAAYGAGGGGMEGEGIGDGIGDEMEREVTGGDS
jgi:hypothetical protein